MAGKKVGKTGDSLNLNIAKDIIARLKADPEFLKEFAVLFEKEGLLEKAREILLPGSIFSRKITVLESSVKYLKENLNLSYKEIAGAVGRDQRNVWQIYNSARQKLPQKFPAKKPRFTIPVSVLKDKKFSALEAIVAHLKDKLGLTYHEIAALTQRNDRTVWTVYKRFKKKSDRPNAE